MFVNGQTWQAKYSPFTLLTLFLDEIYLSRIAYNLWWVSIKLAVLWLPYRFWSRFYLNIFFSISRMTFMKSLPKATKIYWSISASRQVDGLVFFKVDIFKVPIVTEFYCWSLNLLSLSGQLSIKRLIKNVVMMLLELDINNCLITLVILWKITRVTGKYLNYPSAVGYPV